MLPGFTAAAGMPQVSVPPRRDEVSRKVDRRSTGLYLAAALAGRHDGLALRRTRKPGRTVSTVDDLAWRLPDGVGVVVECQTSNQHYALCAKISAACADLPDNQGCGCQTDSSGNLTSCDTGTTW